MAEPSIQFTSKNPVTNEVLWEGQAATYKDIDAAIQTARQAFPDWSSLTFEQRAEKLLAFKEALGSCKQLFAETISKETGKPLWESKTEIDAMSAKVDISIEAQLQRCPEFNRQLLNAASITRHKPHGVAAVFGPFNFPGHLPNGHIIPALLAGNTVVFKPSELTPLTGREMINIWKQSGLPDGVLNLVQGGAETGHLLATHPGINALFFTGSWKTGKLLSEHFGLHPEKIFAAEMGGNNPLVVGDISNLTAASFHIVQSAYLTAGQRCTCARRLIVIEESNEKQLIEKLLSMIADIKVGAYNELPEPFMGPVINEHAAQQLLNAQDKLIQNGGIPLAQMRRVNNGTPLLSPGLIDVTSIKQREDEELFGPLLQLIRVPSFEAAIDEANRTSYGLVASILSDNVDEYRNFFQRVNAGVINWNMPTTGASSAAPFGGIGRSGNHRPSAFFAADYCSYPVASMESDILYLPNTLPPGIQIKEESKQL